MKKIDILIAVCLLANAVILCKVARDLTREYRGIVITWDPKGTKVDGDVTVWGTYAFRGAWHPWRPLCDMDRMQNIYTCRVGVPLGSELEWSVSYKRQIAHGNRPCWIFDQSANIPCGGNGADVGTIVVTDRDAVVPSGLIPNGADMGNAKYFNGSLIVQ